MEPVLSVVSVTKQFRTVRAVDDLSFEVRPGEVFALLGPNGAGKTTVVRMIVGIFRADSGSIEFPKTITDGGTQPDSRLTGYLPEERGLHRDTDVLRTLEYFGALRGMNRRDARGAALRALEDFGLADRAKDRIDTLSKGNQQKVQFLSAFLHRPRFAVLDEPFSGLDPLNQQRFLDEIRRRRDDGCTILISAHQMDLVESLADRLLLINHGRAVLHGTLDEIRRRTGSGTRIELGVSPDDATRPGALEDSIATLNRLPGIARVDRAAADRIGISLDPGARVGQVLNAVTGVVPVTSVHSGAETLREIFIRTVGEDAGRHDETTPVTRRAGDHEST
jgi:ABC-2 type transport system ATP-binding protein